MREIKFRIWDKHDKRMSKNFNYNNVIKHLTELEVIVMQYTRI